LTRLLIAGKRQLLHAAKIDMRFQTSHVVWVFQIISAQLEQIAQNLHDDFFECKFGSAFPLLEQRRIEFTDREHFENPLADFFRNRALVARNTGDDFFVRLDPIVQQLSRQRIGQTQTLFPLLVAIGNKQLTVGNGSHHKSPQKKWCRIDQGG